MDPSFQLDDIPTLIEALEVELVASACSCVKKSRGFSCFRSKPSKCKTCVSSGIDVKKMNNWDEAIQNEYNPEYGPKSILKAVQKFSGKYKKLSRKLRRCFEKATTKSKYPGADINRSDAPTPTIKACRRLAENLSIDTPGVAKIHKTHRKEIRKARAQNRI